MYGAGAHVFAVWSYALANADPRGLVEINASMLAPAIGEPKDRIVEAIKKLMAPDPESRSAAEGGARMVREGQFIYRIVNYAAYRRLRDEDERREHQRTSTRSKRAQSLTTVLRDRPASAQVEEEVEEEVEERREDCSEPTLPGVSEPSPLMVFPVASRGARPTEWGMTKIFCDQLVEAYPAVDVLAEARRALSWIKSNPTKRKTYRGMQSFLDRWMSRCQDRGGTRGPPLRVAAGNGSGFSPSEYPEFED
jgi:hypothetical protein